MTTASPSRELSARDNVIVRALFKELAHLLQQAPSERSLPAGLQAEVDGLLQEISDRVGRVALPGSRTEPVFCSYEADYGRKAIVAREVGGQQRAAWYDPASGSCGVEAPEVFERHAGPAPTGGTGPTKAAG
jgi:hypothetical protein